MNAHTYIKEARHQAAYLESVARQIDRHVDTLPPILFQILTVVWRQEHKRRKS